MKKSILILTVLALAIPAMADTVTITLNVIDDVNGVVEIGYQVSDANLVRAFALDINVSDGNIVDIDDYFVGECNATEQGYGIFLSNILIDEGGNVINYGNPVSTVTPSLPGLGSSGITIEMGSLYEDGNAPDVNGVLCTVTVDTLPTTLCVNVEDTARGGVVMEDVSIVPTVDPPEVCIEFGGCACLGDISGDNKVSITDLSDTVAMLVAGYSDTTPKYTAEPVPDGWDCMNANNDTKISIGDLSDLVAWLVANYSDTTPKYSPPEGVCYAP